MLQVSDSVSRSFIHTLLTEAVERVRTSMNDDRNADYRPDATKTPPKTDFPNELPLAAPLLPPNHGVPSKKQQLADQYRDRFSQDPPENITVSQLVSALNDSRPIPTATTGPQSNLPELGGQCRALVWRPGGVPGSSGRREPCGYQLDRHDVTMDLICPNASNHIGSGEDDESDSFADDQG
jgi:hypothetical protein